MSITNWKITSSVETLYLRSPSQSEFFITSINSFLVVKECFGAVKTVNINSSPINLVFIANLFNYPFPASPTANFTIERNTK